MKYPVTILFSMLAVVAVAQDDCPTASFLAEFTVIGERIFDINDPVLLTNPPGLDGNLTFLREILSFTEEEIAMEERNAIEYFNTRFGLDFTSSEPDENRRRFFQNATFFPINVPILFGATVNRWVQTGSTRSRCFPMREGGFEAVFAGEQMLHGTYGGEQGSVVRPGDLVVYNWYRITVCPQSPIILQFRSITPSRTAPFDGINSIHSEIFHRTLGRGLGRATARERLINPTMRRSDFMGIIVFPAPPAWEIDNE